MSPRMALYGMLWRAALAKVHPRAHRLSLWVAAIATLTVSLVAALSPYPGAALLWGWRTLCACALLIWTWFYLPGAIKLNTPANAQLTPGMRARLVQLSTAAWIVCIVGLALGMADTPVKVVLPTLWFMLATLGMGLSSASSRMGPYMMIAVCPLMFVEPYLPEWAHRMFAHPAFLPLATALLILPGMVLIRAMFPQAGERHWRMLARRNPWRDGNKAAHERSDRSVIQWCQTRALRRASTRRDVSSLLLRGSGPGPQLSEIALGLGMLGLIGLTLLAVAHLSGHVGLITMAAQTGWFWGLLPLLVFQIYSLMLAAESDVPAGQALLRMAPAMPATAPSFNRLLASAMLRSALGAWASALATALVFSKLSGAAALELSSLLSLYCLAIPALALPLRDHARRPHWNAVLQWLCAMAAAGLCIMAAVPAQRLTGLPLLPTAAVFAVLLTGLLVPWRYRAMLQAPFAFPSGRLD